MNTAPKERRSTAKNKTIWHDIPDYSCTSNNSNLDYIASAEGDNGKTVSFGSSRIPQKRRSMHIKHRTEMQKFYRELLCLWSEDKRRNEANPEEILIYNVNSFIPGNEIGLGVVLLEPDVPSTKQKGSVSSYPKDKECCSNCTNEFEPEMSKISSYMARAK